MSLASVDGQVAPTGEARISITDEGLLRGDGAFEVMRLYAGRPFALRDHLDRLRHSCEGLRLEADHDALEARARRAARGGRARRGPAAHRR